MKAKEAKEATGCEYYFSLLSPWAYLGHQRFLDLAKQYGIEIGMKPVKIGAVFAASGGLPLAKRAPQRQAYRLQEMQRWSEFLNVPIQLQPTFAPVPDDLASQLLIAAQLTHGTEAALNLCTKIMQAVWVEQKNIADEATLIALADASGLYGAPLLKAAETASVAEEYQKNTQQAISANVFGVPWYCFDGQSYWGQDRLDFLERDFKRNS